MRALIIEDSVDDAELVVRELERAGYDLTWKRVETAEDMASTLKEENWDIVLSDYDLPCFSGPAALELLKNHNYDIPIIIISGKIGEEAAVDTMRAGASDYIMKDRLTRLSPAVSRELKEAEERRKSKEAVKALQESEERYQTLVGMSPEAILLFGLEGDIAYASPKAIELYGYNTSDDLVGFSALELLEPEERKQGEASFKKILEGESLQGYTANQLKSDGSTFVGESNITVIKDLDGKPVSVITITRDITATKRAEEELRRRSITDELTGLFNRRHFYKVIEDQISGITRNGGILSLIMIDLDGFKDYNDRFGHLNGDEVLVSFAQVIKRRSGEGSMVFRFASDEFIMVLPSTDANKSRKIAEQIQKDWQELTSVSFFASPSNFTFSAGIAQYPQDSETIDGLMFLSDSALYLTKRNGGATVALVSELESTFLNIPDIATMDQVYALAATVDAKDPYTFGHSKRVASLSDQVSQIINLPKKEQLQLHSAALLHDIGKLSIPDVVLRKSESLSRDEWRLMKRHCAEGARIVGHVKDLLDIVPIILYHHEWYNGTGYPAGLLGDRIPRCARIISIADAYDTMTTVRPYRDVIAHEQALEEIKRCTKTQFDPDLADVFCRVIDETVRQDIYG